MVPRAVYGRRVWTGTISRNLELIGTHMTITITFILHISLITESFVTTLALVPILHDGVYYADLGGPALCAAGTPQKRGPLPPPTRGRGRLPNWWASPQVGAGPKLPWHDAGFHYMYFLDTARRAGAKAAMVRLGMAAARPRPPRPTRG